MSINLGNEGVQAARVLSTNEHFAAFREALRAQAVKAMNAALDAPTDHVQRAAGYGQAVRDMHIAVESAATGLPQPAVKKPGPKE